MANGDIEVYGKFIAVDEYPTANVIGLVTPSNLIFHTKDSNPGGPEAPRDIQGAFYGADTVTTKSNILIEGSIVAGELQFDHPNAHLVTNPLLPTYIPPDMPGAAERNTLTALWREL